MSIREREKRGVWWGGGVLGRGKKGNPDRRGGGKSAEKARVQKKERRCSKGPKSENGKRTLPGEYEKSKERRTLGQRPYRGGWGGPVKDRGLQRRVGESAEESPRGEGDISSI